MEKLQKELKGYNPIVPGQLSREEIELSSKDKNDRCKLKVAILKFQTVKKD